MASFRPTQGSGEEVAGYLYRPHGLEVDAGDPDLGTHQQQTVGTGDVLGEQHTGSAPFFDEDRYLEFIVQPGRPQEIELHIADHEGQPGRFAQGDLVMALRSYADAGGPPGGGKVSESGAVRIFRNGQATDVMVTR